MTKLQEYQGLQEEIQTKFLNESRYAKDDKGTVKLNAETNEPLYDWSESDVVAFNAMCAKSEKLWADALPEKNALDHQRKAKERAEILAAMKAEGGNVVHPDAPGAKGNETNRVKSSGEVLSESEVYKAFKARTIQPNQIRLENESFTLQAALKTTMTAAAGFDPFFARTDVVSPYPLRQLRVAELIPIVPTDFDTVAWMEETTHTNNAVEKAEGAALGEAALAYTQRTTPVELCGVTLPVTLQQLEDVPGLRGLVDGRLTYMVLNRIDSQLLVGNGTTPNIKGYLNWTGVQTQAKGADSTIDAIFKAITKVRGTTAGTGFAEPTGIVMHPNDWEPVRLAKTADGIYILGSPTEAGPTQLWGKPALITSAITEGTGLVGDFTGYSELRTKQGMRVEITDSNEAEFLALIYRIRAFVRLALAVHRPSAYCQVTGI